MKIIFIDPTQSIINYGLRTLSQCLVKAGHSVKIVFMNQPSIKYDLEYPESIYEDLFALAEDSDIIGLSFVSNYLGHAEKLTKKLKKNFNKPIIWGGIHAIAAPEMALETADLVCVGEGEKCMLRLIENLEAGKGYQNVPSLWYKENGEIVRNDPSQLNPDIDSYSLPLYNDECEFIRIGDRIVSMNNEIRKNITGVKTNYYSIKDEITYPYLTMGSRGCPNSCSYCCNNLFKKIYRGKGRLVRRRTNEMIIEELEKMIEQMPFINLIEFFDDDFIFTDADTVAEFSELYKSRINLPFRCNFRPESVTYEKINLLYGAGLISAEMGLQSASAKTNKLFKRHFNKETFLKAANILNKFPELVVHYDVIVDNPFEDYEDLEQTLRFIAQLPAPFNLSLFSLTFFPGTQIYEYAKINGLLKNELKEIIGKRNYVQYEYKQPYIKFLFFYIRNVGVNKGIAKIFFMFLTNKNIMRIFDSFLFYPVWFSLFFVKRSLSKIKNKEIELIPH